MSLATFKKKSINKYSSATKRSGKSPGGYWLTQGPFGNNTLKNVMLEDTIKNYGPVGFSLNGSHRSISVGKDMKMSKQGTRFRGQYPYGNGGNGGKYFQAIPVMNAGEGIVSVNGNQWESREKQGNSSPLFRKFQFSLCPTRGYLKCSPGRPESNGAGFFRKFEKFFSNFF